MKRKRQMLTNALFISVVASSASAQEVMTAEETLEVLEAMAAAADPLPYATVLNVPGGSVAPGGLAFVSASGIFDGNSDGGSGDFDGSLAFGIGLGAIAGISAQVSTSITSVSPPDAGDSGSLTLKFGSTVPVSGSDVFWALSVSGFSSWGDAKDNEVRTTATASSRNVVYTDTGGRIAYAWSLGIGDKVAEGDTFGAFGGVAVGVSPDFGLSAAYDGRGVDIGASFLIPEAQGMSVSITTNDVFDTDAASGVTISAAYSFPLF